MLNQDGYFDFEEPIRKVVRRLDKARQDGSTKRADIDKLQTELTKVRREIYAKLNRWQQTQVARHSNRPHALDYVRMLFSDFVELHGDRKFGDDPAIVAGLATFAGHPVVVIGHQKGRDTKQKLHRNFGMPRPEGYRKALRVMRLAEKFNRPIITLIDTPGAYPGIGAEERGQAEAIALNLKTMFGLEVPIVAVVTGEGGSGGALGIGVGDRVLMLEHSVYSVISPEGCASILFKTADKAEQAAEALRLSATDLVELGIIDGIVPEPPGGAHVDHVEAARLLGEELARALEAIQKLPVDERLQRRYDKFRALGVFQEGTASAEAGLS